MPRLDKINNFLEAANGLHSLNGGKNHSRPAPEEKMQHQSADLPIDLASCVRQPKYSLKDVILPTEKTERQVRRVLAEVKYHELIYQRWGMGEKHQSDIALAINCHGPAGTGKSMLLEALASELGLPVLEVPSISSQFMGQTEKIIEAIFQFASSQDVFMVWNEADRDFGNRLETVSQSADAAINSARSILLEQLSAYSGVIGLTTNLQKNYDTALTSRIRLQIEFDLPDVEARAKIWQVQIPSQLPLDDSVNFSELAKQFEGVSGRDIKKAVLNAVVGAASTEQPDSEKQVHQFHFMEAMEEVIAGNKAAAKEEIKLMPATENVEIPIPPPTR